MNFRRLAVVVLCVVGLAACTSPVMTTSSILQDAAVLLQKEGLDSEAKELNNTAKLINDSQQRGEGSIFLGFDPSQRLHELAARLLLRGSVESAQKLDEFADLYFEKNFQGCLQYQR